MEQYQSLDQQEMQSALGLGDIWSTLNNISTGLQTTNQIVGQAANLSSQLGINLLPNANQQFQQQQNTQVQLQQQQLQIQQQQAQAQIAQAEAQAVAARAAADAEAAKARAAEATAKSTETPPEKKDNTLLYVGLGVGGLVLLGGIAYVATRPKPKQEDK